MWVEYFPNPFFRTKYSHEYFVIECLIIVRRVYIFWICEDESLNVFPVSFHISIRIIRRSRNQFYNFKIWMLLLYAAKRVFVFAVLFFLRGYGFYLTFTFLKLCSSTTFLQRVLEFSPEHLLHLYWSSAT